MKYLLYCIFQQDPDELPPQPGVCVVAARGLAAVFSPVEESGAAPAVSALLAYEKVVEAIHARVSVIPLRYGCLVESEPEIVRLLEDHHREYEALLGRFRGMTEMGIRVLCPPRPQSFPGPPGTAYLAALRDRYNLGDSFAPEEERMANRITGLLSGCYTEQRREIAPAERGRLASLYFLTPRSRVKRFRSQVRQIRFLGNAKLLLTGPWPPYNFAAPLG